MTALPRYPPAVHRPCRGVWRCCCSRPALAPRLFQSGQPGVSPCCGRLVLSEPFWGMTGDVPLAWLWMPCMVTAIGVVALLIFMGCAGAITLAGSTGITAARAFILAELAASVEWQLHCCPLARTGAAHGSRCLWLLLAAGVRDAVYGLMFWLERRRPLPDKASGQISNKRCAGGICHGWR